MEKWKRRRCLTLRRLPSLPIDKIAESLKGMLGGGSASISTTVDPSILGGLTVKIGDKFLDLSVKSKVDAVSRSLATA